ncbi:MAG: UvrD-helicase domain-containing protein [Zavarzinella sp.]
MQFLISDTFTDSLLKLTGEEQKAVKNSAFDLQMNPANPGLKFHKLDRAKDKRFWSVRVNKDIRLIVHKSDDSLLLCYVDHHDPAYDWAARRKLETHPQTGAAQLVEIRETVQDVLIPRYVDAETPAIVKAPLFARLSEKELLSYGVPAEWIADVRTATEDSYLTIANHLPAEAAEALLEIATGGKPVSSVPEQPISNPFTHPDAQRRFRVLTNQDELAQALDSPWEKWTIFLHPDQRDIAYREYSGPARVSGTAGTGKTVVALHRTVHLARKYPQSRVLLATFTKALAANLQRMLRRLVAAEPLLADRIDIQSLDELGLRLYRTLVNRNATMATRTELLEIIDSRFTPTKAEKFTRSFVIAEWDQIVDAWQVHTWEEYRDIPRPGRKIRLSEANRERLWQIMLSIQKELVDRKLKTSAAIFTELCPVLEQQQNKPYDFAVVDEAQDLSVAQLRFLAALAAHRPNGLFFTGDLGQRIFQQPISWKALGVDIRGRSRTLRVNYRTSHQIRTQADRLLDPEITDMDGNREKRNDTISVFEGPVPVMVTAADAEQEKQLVADWLLEQISLGVQPHEIGLFVRSSEQLDRALSSIEQAKLKAVILDDGTESKSGHVTVATMHLAKGFEFRSVAVMACDDEVIPLQNRIEEASDEADLKEVYETERHLLYVACTRARDCLLLSGIDPVSEFLQDMA